MPSLGTPTPIRCPKCNAHVASAVGGQLWVEGVKGRNRITWRHRGATLVCGECGREWEVKTEEYE